MLSLVNILELPLVHSDDVTSNFYDVEKVCVVSHFFSSVCQMSASENMYTLVSCFIVEMEAVLLIIKRNCFSCLKL